MYRHIDIEEVRGEEQQMSVSQGKADVHHKTGAPAEWKTQSVVIVLQRGILIQVYRHTAKKKDCDVERPKKTKNKRGGEKSREKRMRCTHLQHSQQEIDETSERRNEVHCQREERRCTGCTYTDDTSSDIPHVPRGQQLSQP